MTPAPVRAKRASMFVNFFHDLKSAGVPVTLKEYLTLMQALEAPVIHGSVEDFYYLARASLVKDLSHGMRQRLVYASTFLQRPKIMFVDEPFVGLDPHSIRAIKDLLRRKVEGGMTIFLTTHSFFIL